VRQRLSTARLVTLTGVGGAGKTRLAVRVGSDLRRVYPDGVWHVELAALTDDALIGYAVLATLGLPAPAGLSPVRFLAEHLADRELMLILDNCEHLLDGCATFAVSLLPACPRLRILCTSRQPLGVLGEVVVTVPPLPVPRNGATVNDIGRPYPAVTLFAERAVAATPEFTLTAGNEPFVAEICTRLDGLPLAIELAAARLRTLSVEQLADRLADRFGVLTARHATPLHHRRLRETLDWSFELCSPAERTLWSRLAVFRGTFDLDAVVAVCASDDLPRDAVVESLGGLIDKSIALREDTAGQARYRLLETVREYGLSRLSPGDGPDTAPRRHRDWFWRLAERFDGEWFGPDQLRWASRMQREHDNLRVALNWCLSTPGEGEAGRSLAAALRHFWIGCGALGEGRHWLERVLAADPRPTAAYVRARTAYSRVLITQADMAAAVASTEETLALARTLHDPVLEAAATFEAGTATLWRGEDLDRAETLLEDALSRFVAVADPLGQVMTQTTLAYPPLFRGDPQRAEALCTEARETCRRHGDRWWLAYTLQASAIIAFSADAVDDGRRYAEEAIVLHHQLGDNRGVASALDRLAYAATAGGELERAACLMGANFQISQSTGQDPNRLRRHLPEQDQSSLESIRARLGDRAFDAAFDRGRRMTEDEMVRYASGTQPRTGGAPRRQAVPGPPLTRREREVAELIAQGLSNQQIATTLTISQRTAESHVENILRKLGFTSRTQIVTWVIQNRRDSDGA